MTGEAQTGQKHRDMSHPSNPTPKWFNPDCPTSQVGHIPLELREAAVVGLVEAVEPLQLALVHCRALLHVQVLPSAIQGIRVLRQRVGLGLDLVLGS